MAKARHLGCSAAEPCNICLFNARASEADNPIYPHRHSTACRCRDCCEWTIDRPAPIKDPSCDCFLCAAIVKAAVQAATLGAPEDDGWVTAHPDVRPS